jgi:hypothetical protein
MWIVGGRRCTFQTSLFQGSKPRRTRSAVRRSGAGLTRDRIPRDLAAAVPIADRILRSAIVARASKNLSVRFCPVKPNSFLSPR